MKNEPLVSILCETYNHENFIREAIEGFLMQQTTFPFEILIHDDASTDNTPKIIREYEHNYPELIFPIYQKENQFSKGKRPRLAFQIPRARGKYIALCEGDDYWTDPLKLQKQVEFLEGNGEYVACFTNATKLNLINGVESHFCKWEENREVNANLIINIGGGVYPTPSLVFKNIFRNDLPNFYQKTKSVDRALIMHLMYLGKIYYLNEITCCYRMHLGGVSTFTLDKPELIIETHKTNIAFMLEFNLYTNKEYDNELTKSINNTKISIVKLNRKNILSDLKYLLSIDLISAIKIFKSKYISSH